MTDEIKFFEPKCVYCAAWKQNSSLQGGPKTGTCHANPPELVVTGQSRMGQPMAGSMFPPIPWDEFCVNGYKQASSGNIKERLEKIGKIT